MKHLGTLILMQLKDKIDFSFANSKKTLIRKIVFTLLKFVIVAAAAFGVRYVLTLITTLNVYETPTLLGTLLCGLYVLSVLSCTVGLVKTLYLADDNRVLITLPVGNNLIFISKMIVYYLYELIREYMFITPVIIGVGLTSVKQFGLWFIPWTMVVTAILPALPVLLGALLSIPALYIGKAYNRVPPLKLLTFAGVVGLAVWACIAVGMQIPEKLNFFTNTGAVISNAVKWVITTFNVPPFSYLVTLMVGTTTDYVHYTILSGRVFLIFGIVVGAVAVLFFTVFAVSRPLFFTMMSKSFEFEKRAVKSRPNRAHGKVFAFLNKEFRLCVMDTEISAGYLATYVAVPLLVYLLNKMYYAIEGINGRGFTMAYACNVLIMLLPMLSSNSIISTLFSREGRAGYMKKTKPVDILLPIGAKLFFVMVMSVPSIAATVAVFGSFSYGTFKVHDLILLALMLIFFQFGHIILSSMLDLMNPQNEQYATVGDSARNPNETSSTLVAFAVSFIAAVFSYLFFSESGLKVTVPLVKLACMGAVFMTITLILFIKSIRAYYYEKQGGK